MASEKLALPQTVHHTEIDVSDSRNDLIGALVGFGTDAVNLLRDRFGEPAFNPTFYWDWERSGDEHFAAKERIGWNTFEWYEVWEDAKNLDSYAEAVEALEADSRTEGQLGRLVGTQRSQTGLVPERLFLSELVYPAVTEARSYDLDSDNLRPHAEHLIEALAADTVETLELVQTLGLIGGEAETEATSRLGLALRHSCTPRRSIEVRAQCNPAGCRIAVLGHIGGLSCCT